MRRIANCDLCGLIAFFQILNKIYDVPKNVTEYEMGVLIFSTTCLKYIITNEQFDAQSLYFIISILQSSTCFEKRRAHHQEVKLY